MVLRHPRIGPLGQSVDNTNLDRSNSNLCNIPKHPSTYTEATLKRTIDHFYLSKGHTYRAPGPAKYLPIGRPGEVVIYQDSLKAGLRFPLHSFLVEFFCTFNLSPDQLVSNVLRMLNYYLLVCIRRGIEPSIDVFRLLFEMKLLDRYDCYVVYSHRDRGLPSHDHFKIPNCPSNNSWKNRYFFVKLVDGIFPFPLDWSILPLKEFNSTPILTGPEIDSLIILRATEPLGRSMNDALTDDALVSASIGRLYESSRPRPPRVVSETQLTCNMRWPIEKVTKDCLAITSCLDWEVIEASKDKSPESLERSIMVEERRILSLRHSPFRKIRDQAKKIEQTGHLLEEKNRELCDRRMELAEKTEMINEREARVVDLEKSLQEREYQLQQTGNRVQTLEDSVAQLSQELAVKEKVAIEEYKGSEEYMTTVDMVGIRGRDMAFRKSREWLAERFPDVDYSGAPFMPSVEEDDNDAESDD
ncbi:Uncharacterized protein Adt_46585 [Abeliophyllum distichum]|uniref:Transposase (putative) gypsy type domain-containing protein n=1 Tax=Abeliophyllum distichum TaxID=126358 RepID=A0ABD1NZ59_9LAMI